METTNYGFGICVVTKDGLAGGAVPLPLSDFEQDWYWWEAGNQRQNSESVITLPIDVRTSRRLRGGYRLALIGQNGVNELSTFVDVSLRTLCAGVRVTL